MAAGDGLCAAEAVRVLVEEGPRYVRELVDWGARFDRDAHGEIALAREAAHAVRRVLHATDATGRELGRALWVKASASSRLAVLNHTRAIRADHRGRRLRRRSLHGGRRRIADRRRCPRARRAAGHRWRRPGVQRHHQSGDCHRRWVCLAWSAGARVADMEFVQFHPTALDVPGTARALLSEALRGEGARLINAAGESLHVALRPGRRPGAARPRRPRHRPRARAGPESRFTSRCGTSMPSSMHARFPTVVGRVPCGRAGSGARPDSRRTRRRTTSWAASRPTLGAHHRAWAVRGRRSGLHRRARRQPPRQQLAARGVGLRRRARLARCSRPRRRGSWPVQLETRRRYRAGARRAAPGAPPTEADVVT